MKGRTVLSVEMVEVIKVKAVIGEGTKKDPVRVVNQYWDKKGNKLIEIEENHVEIKALASL